MTYLWHVTLDTGHRRQSYRPEASQIAIDAVDLELRRALRDGVAEIRLGAEAGTIPVYRLKASNSGPVLLATILRDIGKQDVPLVTMAVAPKSRGAAEIWRALHDGRDDIPYDPDSIPPAPWCAARFEAGIEQDLRAATWLGDYERLLAWAWIEGKGKNG
ncbi:hypothetical protein ASD64_08860 [Mesorhizobium sp. Root157]|uniref:hypothetical protein n=1 Tax=Mesorhizobium sp. Root157 TaxID=1736477 RepID=UPI000700A2FE|nr:hypothetical protein [Mesorhizobium sp. Root157]KQZ81860.1 hypothetical protein ASD64_08860 [Mesorhizobium sp. Root157]